MPTCTGCGEAVTPSTFTFPSEGEWWNLTTPRKEFYVNVCHTPVDETCAHVVPSLVCGHAECVVGLPCKRV